MKHSIIYSKEQIIEIANTYPNRSEFREHDWIAFKQAEENGWLDEIIPRKNPIMTYEKAWNIAKQYTDHALFHKEQLSAYTKALKKGWIKDYTWIKKGNRDLTRKDAIVYTFTFEKQHAIYVGITINEKRRYKQHLKNENDAIYIFMKENGLTTNDFTYNVILKGIDSITSSKLENVYIDKYRTEGWQILNRVKGGSLGARQIIWTEEKCLELAKQFKYTKDFADTYPGAYNKSLITGWRKQYTWLEQLKPKYIYNYQECWDKAKDFTLLYNFKTKASTYYNFARREGWLKDYTWLGKTEKRIMVEYDMNGDLIMIHDNLSKEIGKDINAAIACARGDFQYHANKIWRYADTIWNEKYEIPQHIDVNIICETWTPVIQYTKEGDYIKEYKTIKDTGFNSSTIGDACKGIKAIYAFGYLWRYKADVLDENGNVLQHVEARENQCNKTLIQYDVEGNYIAEFENQTKAIKSGHKRGAIEWTANYKFDDRLFKYNEIWLLKKDVLKQFGKIPMKIDVKETLSVLSNMIL